MTTKALTLTATFLCAGAGCAPLNPGVPGDPAVTYPAIDGTVFTIVFENENADAVLSPALPTFYELSRAHGRADAYISDVHPSLPNYIQLTSGQTHGITISDDPASNIRIDGSEHLADQLDAASVPWRAYMESMGEPCRTETAYPYKANHNPFVYYTSLTGDPARCRERVVDFDAHFAADLASDAYRFMFIVPNNCNNMHDCPAQTADAWLATLIPQIMASPGYQNGGVIFVLFDEGHLRIGSAAANLATIVLSPRLIEPQYATDTRFGHRSYLATIEDIFGLPRLPTTVDATPMSEFFVARTTPR
jgi:phosphatidylinositol-3-phosphatase